MQWRAQFHAALDDFTFLQGDHRRHDFDFRLWSRPLADYVLKSAIVLWPAIGIAGAVFGHRADVYRARSDRFGPAHRHGKKMRIAKWHVGDRNAALMRRGRVELIFGNADVLVRQRRTADRTEVIELHDE